MEPILDSRISHISPKYERGHENKFKIRVVFCDKSVVLLRASRPVLDAEFCFSNDK